MVAAPMVTRSASTSPNPANSTTVTTTRNDRSIRQLNMVCTVRALSAQVATAQDDRATRAPCHQDRRKASTVSSPFRADRR